MAKIIKVGSQNITPVKNFNPSKTSRNSTTNPFKYSNFEGNTLQFADVFEGFDSKKNTMNTTSFKGTIDKMKLISSSVVGSMNKIKTGIAEPIVNFVNRISSGISSAWDYAKNTNISEVPIVKSFNDLMNTNINLGPIDKLADSVSELGSSISSKVAGVGKGISSTIDLLNTDLTDIGKSLSGKWTSLISSCGSKKISADMPVVELETLLRDELEGMVA